MMKLRAAILFLAFVVFAASGGLLHADEDDAEEFDEYDEDDFEPGEEEFLGWYMVPHPDYPDSFAKLRYFGGIPKTDTEAPIILKKASGAFARLPQAGDVQSKTEAATNENIEFDEEQGTPQDEVQGDSGEEEKSDPNAPKSSKKRKTSDSRIKKKALKSGSQPSKKTKKKKKT